MSRILDFSDGFTSNVEPTSEALPAANVSNTPSGNLSATNAQAALNELQGDIDTINAKVGAVNGIATLDSNGKVPTTQMPALALTDVYVVADIAARNALTVEEGDVAKVLNNGSDSTCTYVYDGSSWVEIQADAQLALHEADTSTHGVSGAILGTSDAQVITNKDIDGGTASNSRRITIPKDTLSNLQALTRKEAALLYATDKAKPYFDNGSALVAVGSGSGSGAKNFILNPDAETDTSGWAAYADAAGTAPVDGTGGSPAVTWTRTTSSPLSLDASFLFTKDAASRQGQGASYDFTIDRADQAKVCRIDFDYEVASGTYADGDLTVWLYDVTNAQLIQPSASSILNAIGPQKKQSLSFQTNSNSTSYRLIIHVASTSASAYTVKFDNVSVTRESISQGTVVTDWVSYTPTLTNGTNVSVTKVSWRRVGDSVEILGYLSVTGAGSGADLAVSMPSGIVMDTGKINGSANNHVLGSGEWLDSGTGRFVLMPVYASTTGFSFQKQQIGSLQGSDLASGDAISFTIRVPILGWSSSQQLSSDAETRVVAGWVGGSSTTITSGAGATTVIYGTTVEDTHGDTYNTSTGAWTCKIPGWYQFDYKITDGSITPAAADRSIQISLSVDGAGEYGIATHPTLNTQLRGVTLGGSFKLKLRAGQVVRVRAESSLGDTYSVLNNTGYSYLQWCMIQGPAQIAASEVVAARIQQSSPIFLGNGIDTHFALQSTTFDTHGGYNSSTGYTVRASGFYKVGACVQIESYSGWVVGESLRIALRKNASTDIVMALSEAVSGTQQVSLNGSALIRCNAGDVLQVYVQQISGAALNTLNTASTNWITFERLGGIS